MTLQFFIRKHRKEIDKVIFDACDLQWIDDDERELWILNDEGLYNWAISEGVDLTLE